MTLFLENSFSLNNYISISNRIKKIPFYYLHFVPIHCFKNLDEHYKLLPISKSNLIQREIKYKLVYFSQTEEYSRDIERINNTNDTNNTNNNDNKEIHDNKLAPIDVGESFVFKDTYFASCIYHVFYSCSILHANKISFTPLNDCTFISSDTGIPLLYDFSQSFYFPIIQHSTFKMYFPESLLHNSYIPFDLFLIVYLTHHSNDCCCEKYIDTILELFSSSRENIELNTINKIKTEMIYFHNYPSDQIIQYLLQFKYTWSYYSLCYFFIVHYSDLLHQFSLNELFYSYIHSSCKDRNITIVDDIHSSMFST